MPEGEFESPVVGRLSDLRNGLLTGTLTASPALISQGKATVEIFAHGILAASGEIPVEEGEPDRACAFEIPLQRFPNVKLPCDLTARIAETDEMLESEVSLLELEDLWLRMMPFRARIGGSDHGHIRIEVVGEAAAPVFELREGARLLGISESGEQGPEGGTIYRIALPDVVLDGREHRLRVFHRDSGLPLQLQPLRIRLDMQHGPIPGPRELLSRVEAIEHRLDDRYVEVFNQFATDIYRHIDAVTLNQRNNFEREIAALRRLLDLPDAREAARAALSEPAGDITVHFADSVNGYGIHGVKRRSTGKDFRFVAPAWGMMLPGTPDRAMRLHIQGLRRPHPEIFDMVELMLNGHRIEPKLYLNPRSESWNISAVIPPEMGRRDSNVMEVRFAEPKAEAGRKRSDAAGVLFVTLSPEEAAHG